ncbi:MAG: hypothetical protein ACFFCI_12135 [Promethearchaeota archaeon]
MVEKQDQIIKELRKYDLKSLRKVIEDERNSLMREAKIGRETAGLIIASSFTISVLLLSFITQRNLILELGIIFLFISIFFMLELYFMMAITEVELGVLEENLSDLTIRRLENMMMKKSILIMLANRGGTIFFYLGIIYLTLYFNLFLFVIPAILYLWVRFIYSQYDEIKYSWNFCCEHREKAEKWRNYWKENRHKKEEEKIKKLKEYEVETMFGSAYNYQIRLKQAGVIIGIALKLFFFSLTIPLFISIVLSF